MQQVSCDVDSSIPSRLARAHRILEDLLRDVESCATEREFRGWLWVEGSAPDILHLSGSVPELPVMDWALRFGEGVHHLRACLDMLAQQLCRLDGASPQKPRRVQFPVVKSSADWRRAAQDLESMPGSLLARIEALQPYHGTVLSRVLQDLHSVDISDKHYALMNIQPVIVGEPGELVPADVLSQRIPTGLPDLPRWTRWTLDREADIRGRDTAWPVRVPWQALVAADQGFGPLRSVTLWLAGGTRAIVDAVTQGVAILPEQLPPIPWVSEQSAGSPPTA